MPVGSCLGGQIDNNEEANNGMEVIMTSSLLNQADQFAFMQQTLLMQVRTKTSTLWFMDFSRGRVRKMLSDCWLIFCKNARKMLHSVEKSPKISNVLWFDYRFSAFIPAMAAASAMRRVLCPHVTLIRVCVPPASLFLTTAANGTMAASSFTNLSRPICITACGTKSWRMHCKVSGNWPVLLYWLYTLFKVHLKHCCKKYVPHQNYSLIRSLSSSRTRLFHALHSVTLTPDAE